MATVLVTGAGGAGGIGAIRTLTERTDHNVVAADMDTAAAGLYLADQAVTIPAADDPEWIDSVTDAVRATDTHVVVPTVDEELPQVENLRESLPEAVSIVAPRQAAVDIALDKYRTYRVLHEAGHTVPRSWLAADPPGSEAYPLIAKPRRGRGSRGVERLETEADLTEYLRGTDCDRDGVLLQEFIAGDEYTTSVTATQDNRLLGVVPKEAIEKDGSTTRGVTRDAPAVAETCRKIFRTIQPAGPMNVQQIIDESGSPYTIEINPRFSSTSCLTAAAGVDEFDLLVRDAVGESVSAPDGYESGIYLFRYDNHTFVPADERVDVGAVESSADDFVDGSPEAQLQDPKRHPE
jgi:carbamoyl-phosphate synthase large subunit